MLLLRHFQLKRMYLCYNSFKRCWFWGPKRLSEKFRLGSKRLPDLILEYGGHTVWSES